jgi:hypothetical protein
MSSPTTISKRHVIAVAFLGIAITLSFRPWRAISNGNLNSPDPRPGCTTANESPVESHDIVEPLRTKSHIPIDRSQPTIEETIKLLRPMIIQGLDLPAGHPVSEGIASINDLIHKTGVEPSRLRLTLKSADPANQRGIRYEFKIQEMPLTVTLKYFCEASGLRYHVRENGIIELTSWSEEPPFNLPDPSPKTVTPPPGETDIFGNDLDASKEPHPFADPPAR